MKILRTVVAPLATLTGLRLVALRLLALGMAATLLSAPVAAEGERDFYLLVGPAHINLQNNFSEFAVGGTVDPAADATVTDEATLLINGVYKLQKDMSVSFTAGIPLESTGSGAGSVEALGELGVITFGVAGFHANKHFETGTPWQPFVGAGLAYGIVFDTDDGALTGVEIDNEIGLEVRGGFDYKINDRYGAYFAVSKAFLEFNIEGTATTPAGPAPATVKAALDPVAIQLGMSYRF